MIRGKLKTLAGFALFIMLVAYMGWYVLSKREAFSREVVSTSPLVVVEDRALAPSPPAKDFFVDSRIERQLGRDRQMELLRGIVQSPGSSPGTRQEAERRLMELAEALRKELEAETLIKAKGFDDALVYINGQGAVVIVKAAELSAQDVAKVADVVSKATGLDFSRLNIMARPR